MSFLFNNFVITHKTLGYLQNRFRNSCTKQKHATVWICRSKNVFDIFNKSHIKHFIAFIKNEVFNFADIKCTTIYHILNTTGSSYNNFSTSTQRPQLISVTCTAINNASTREKPCCKRSHFGTSLHCKFTGWFKNNCFNMFAFCA